MIRFPQESRNSFFFRIFFYKITNLIGNHPYTTDLFPNFPWFSTQKYYPVCKRDKAEKMVVSGFNLFVFIIPIYSQIDLYFIQVVRFASTAARPDSHEHLFPILLSDPHLSDRGPAYQLLPIPSHHGPRQSKKVPFPKPPVLRGI